jgi:hypothetical protein
MQTIVANYGLFKSGFEQQFGQSEEKSSKVIPVKVLFMSHRSHLLV